MAIREKTFCRKIWTREETAILVESYLNRIEEFQHIRKKKYAYTNMLEDLISRGKLGREITVTMVEAKMKSLYKTYKAAKTKPDAEKYMVPLIDEMEEIFGKRFNDSINHTLNVAPIIEVKCDPELSIFDFSEEVAASATSENTTVDKSSETKLMKEIYWTKMLELKEKRLQLFQMKEENAERRHKEKMEFLKYREVKAEKRHKETMEVLNRIFP